MIPQLSRPVRRQPGTQGQTDRPKTVIISFIHKERFARSSARFETILSQVYLPKKIAASLLLHLPSRVSTITHLCAYWSSFPPASFWAASISPAHTPWPPIKLQLAAFLAARSHHHPGPVPAPGRPASTTIILGLTPAGALASPAYVVLDPSSDPSDSSIILWVGSRFLGSALRHLGLFRFIQFNPSFVHVKKKKALEKILCLRWFLYIRGSPLPTSTPPFRFTTS